MGAWVPLTPLGFAWYLAWVRYKSLWQGLRQVSRSGTLLLYGMFLIVSSMYYARNVLKSHESTVIAMVIVLMGLAMLFGSAVDRELARTTPNARSQSNEEETERYVTILLRISLALFVVAHLLGGLSVWYANVLYSNPTVP